MAKPIGSSRAGGSNRAAYKCGECGWQAPKWVGRCGECQAWGTVDLIGGPQLRQVSAGPVTVTARPIGEIDVANAASRATGVGELDRVLGGGLVPGAVVLLAGEPGVGKSTLLLEVAAQAARTGRRALYITGEESAAQVRLRGGRINALDPQLFLAAESDLGAVLGQIDAVQPELLVLDSVQTISSAEVDGAAGGVTQVREVAAALIRVAKERNIATVLIGHVTRTDPSPDHGSWSISSTSCSSSRASDIRGCGSSARPRTATAPPTRSAASTSGMPAWSAYPIRADCSCHTDSDPSSGPR